MVGCIIFGALLSGTGQWTSNGSRWLTLRGRSRTRRLFDERYQQQETRLVHTSRATRADINDGNSGRIGLSLTTHTVDGIYGSSERFSVLKGAASFWNNCVRGGRPFRFWWVSENFRTTHSQVRLQISRIIIIFRKIVEFFISKNIVIRGPHNAFYRPPSARRSRARVTSE